MRARPGSLDRSHIVFAGLVLALAAGGVALLVLSFGYGKEADDLAANGVRTEARVIVAPSHIGTGGGRGTTSTGRVAFETEGSGIGPEFADFTACSAQPAVAGETVTILYDPADPSEVRLLGCTSDDTNAALILGIGLLAFDAVIVLIERSRRKARTARVEPAASSSA